MERMPTKPAEAHKAEAWTPREEIPIEKDYFAFQLGVAEVMAERNQTSLVMASKSYAPMIFRNIRRFDRAQDTYVKHPDLTRDNFLEIAYGKYLKEVRTDLIPYQEGHRFGCSSCTFDPDTKVAQMHFVNAEYGPTGPLQSDKVAQRRSEIADAVRTLEAEHPDVTTMTGNSWLYNLDAYRRLYPASFTDHLVPNTEEESWQKGTMLWGQFLTSDGTLNKELASVLTERLKALPPDAPLTSIMTEPLMLPLRASAPIEDFYREYGVED